MLVGDDARPDLARTIAGMINWRTAMLHLLRMEEPGLDDDEAQRIMCRKAQIVVAHQRYDPNNRACPYKKAIDLCFRRLRFFDLVYNDDKKFQSICRRLRPSVLLDSTDFCSRDTIKSNEERRYFEQICVQRVGKLKIGEGKAENQMHALPFVNGMVLQAMDMNQYATLENGFKVPISSPISDFGTPSNPFDNNNTSVIPRYRIVGFPEWTYTRRLSLVGELMGPRSFVTIKHRVLDWPLRVRAHYGHPDFSMPFGCETVVVSQRHLL